MKKQDIKKVIGQIAHLLVSKNPETWVCPFIKSSPISISGGKAYTGGLNKLILSLTALSKGYTSPLWGTASAWRKLGEKVDRLALIKKGEKATYVFWIKVFQKTEEEQEQEQEKTSSKKPVIFYGGAYPVFNQQQTTLEGVDLVELMPKTASSMANVKRITDHSDIIGLIKMPLPKIITGEAAYYSPVNDTVVIPALWSSPQDRAMTIFHELAHASGHESRLNRKFGHRGTIEYAQEEVTAEMAALFLCQETGVEVSVENSYNYGAGWAQYMRELAEGMQTLSVSDAFEEKVYYAVAAGWKAARYMLGRPNPDEESS